MLKTNRSLLFILAVAFIAACQTATIQPKEVQMGYEYYPLQVGNYIIYNAYQADFCLICEESDTNIVEQRYQLMELVADSFPNQANETVYTLHRFKRDTTTRPWVIDSVWQTQLKPGFATRTENNIAIINLVFPLEQGKSWDAYKYTSHYENETRFPFAVTDFDKADVINGNSFASTLKVIQTNDTTNCLGRYYNYDEYAAGVGIVRRIQENYKYKESNPPCMRTDVESGRILHLEVAEYGKQ